MLSTGQAVDEFVELGLTPPVGLHDVPDAVRAEWLYTVGRL